ncbi:MAG: SprT family zinc-dependent metalloprotease [Novosphingobium sp.]
MRLPDWLKPGGQPADNLSITLGNLALPLVIRRLPNARRLTLRLAPDGSEVRVSAPRTARSAEVVAFAHAHAAWLAGQLARVPPRVAIGPGGAVPFRGQRLTVRHEPHAPRRPQLADGALRLGGTVESLTPRLRRWLEGEARRLMREDLAEYTASAGLPAPPLSLSNARRRWGSCSARGNIRLNWRLVMAPDAVRRSVVAHEVAHLVHFDHGPRFHALLGELFEGDLAAANAWLKREGQGLYAPFG